MAKLYDRRRGGRPTPCYMEADLDQLVVTDKLRVLYKGKKPTDMEQIGEGGYGTVFMLQYADGTEFIMMKLAADEEALTNLKTAEGLRDCDLVEFKAVNINDREIWTLMEVMEKDVFSMKLNRRKRDARDFAIFMRRTLQCLLREPHAASFTDMKPRNVAVKACKPKDSFRLIDLDGINGVVSSIPAIPKFTSECETPEEQRMQTVYAFAVTAMFFELESPVSMFYYYDLAPFPKRMRFMLDHLGRTKVPEVAMLIMDVDFKTLEALENAAKPKKIAGGFDIRSFFGLDSV